MTTCWRVVTSTVAIVAALLAVGAAARRPEGATADGQSAAGAAHPAEPAAAERGRAALLGRCFSAPLVPRGAYETLWKQWGLDARPDDFDARVRDRYGLHDAPYPNDGLPMGLRATQGRRGGAAVGIDCMLCHGGAIFGNSVVGLPNTSIDLAALFRDLDLADGGLGFFPYRLSNVRGTTESTATGIYLISLRDAELSLRLPPADLRPIPDQLCEDAPAWWLLKRKRTMYHNGQIDARAVRPLMTFMLTPSMPRAAFDREEQAFADIRQFLQTIDAPKYPLPVDSDLASRGRVTFEQNCAKCHGTYGDDPSKDRGDGDGDGYLSDASDCHEDGDSGGKGVGSVGRGAADAVASSARGDYPNKIVPLEKIGTDPSLVRGLTPAIEEHFRQSWLLREPAPDGRPFPLRYNAGYQAPPLDGVWATAPYLHNGSVPTLHHLLKSDERPRAFTRSYRTDLADYDAERVGWRVTEVSPAAAGAAHPPRSVYDTAKPGRSNAGHTYGDDLTPAERRAIIEYLKTL